MNENGKQLGRASTIIMDAFHSIDPSMMVQQHPMPTMLGATTLAAMPDASELTLQDRDRIAAAEDKRARRALKRMGK